MGKMNCETVWIEDVSFESSVRGHKVLMDAHKEFGGKDRGPTPKELLLTSITGCSGMDVASLLKKFRQPIKSFKMLADTHTTEGHPSVFAEVNISFVVEAGEGVEAEKVIKAVTSSMTKYCGVSAMIAEVCPIHFKVILNGTEIYAADASFQIPGF
ncbi:MAG: OsmC family protein [Bdellovibrionia bacterium]